MFQVFHEKNFTENPLCTLGAVFFFHEKDGNHENDEDNSDSYKEGVECWIRGNHGNDENHGNLGCKPRVPQTMASEMPDKGGAPTNREEKFVYQYLVPTEFLMGEKSPARIIPEDVFSTN